MSEESKTQKPSVENREKPPNPTRELRELELLEETLADLVEDQSEGARGGWIPKSIDRTGCKFM
jgi:hypothetical protein